MPAVERSPAYVVASPRGPSAGAALLALAAVSAVACVALLWGARDDLWRLVAAALCAALTAVAAHQGKRRRIPVLRDLDAVRALAQHTGIPLALYLRRFKHDAASDQPPATEGDAGGSDEAQVAQSFAPFSLFVAIGRPGEPLPPWGAYRLYVADEDWQRQVAVLIGMATCIVVRVDPSAALQWELAQIRQAGKLQRTLFPLPAHGPVWDPVSVADGAPRAIERPAASDTRYAAYLTLDAASRPRLHARDLSQSYGDAARQVAQKVFDLEVLSAGQRRTLRGFYGRAERFLEGVTLLCGYGFMAGMATGMLTVLMLLLSAVLLPSGAQDAVMDLVMPVLDPLLMGSGVVTAVSIGGLVLMAAMRERLLP